MKKRLYVILIMVILSFATALPALAVGYENDDVVCSVDSLIKGNVSQGSDVTETALGDLTADALLRASGADAAIVNGGELKTNISAGPCKWSDILSVFEENKSIAVAQVTASQLWSLLEYGVGFTTIGSDEKTDYERSSFAGFPQIAGMELEYDVTAPAGSRIKHILVGGTEVRKDDSQTTFKLCATQFMLSGGYGYEPLESESLNMGLADALAGYLKAGDYTATTASAERMTALGTKDQPLISRGVLLILGLFGCMCAFIYSKAKKKADPDRTLYSHTDPDRRRLV